MQAAFSKPESVKTEVDLSRRDDGQRRRILYAEDQVSSRIVTTAMLEKMGFEVDAVDDGEGAVDLAAKGAYDFILLDIEMPVMDGVTAARIIRADNENHRKTPILALSAFLADSTENCIWRGAFDTALPKPASLNEIRNAMLIAMGKHEPSIALESAKKPTVWCEMEQQLPQGVRRALVLTAAEEMEHLALALAAAKEAGMVVELRKCRHALRGVALNFGLPQVADILSAPADRAVQIDIQMVLASIRDWRSQRIH